MKDKRIERWAFLLCLTAAILAASPAAASPHVAWIHQFGTDVYDYAHTVALDAAGNLYVHGEFDEHLETSQRGVPFLRKYDSSGAWVDVTDPFIRPGEYPGGMGIDGAGNIFIRGVSLVPLDENLYAPGDGSKTPADDGFTDLSWSYGQSIVGKFDPSGSPLWWKPTRDYHYFNPDITVDPAGNWYVIEKRSDEASVHLSYLTKYDNSGQMLWSKHLDLVTTHLSDVVLDAHGNTYMSGLVEDTTLPQTHGTYVVKHDPDGNVIWSEKVVQHRAESPHPVPSIDVDAAGNVYVSAMHHERDLWVPDDRLSKEPPILKKLSPEGELLWSRETPLMYCITTDSMTVDSAGNCYVVGKHVSGSDLLLYSDIAVALYDSEGNSLGSTIVETPWLDRDHIASFTADDEGHLYIAGWTTGDLGGPNAGYSDAFVLMIVPEPGTLSLLSLCGLVALRRRKRFGVGHPVR